MRLRTRTAPLAAGLLAIGTAAHSAPPPSDAGPPIHLPLEEDANAAVLIQAPGNNDLEREYPQIALRMRFAGFSSMTCKALVTGRLDDCHVVSENPIGMGFGAAEIRTAVYFRAQPATRDGQPVESTMTIPMRWQVGETKAPAPLVLAPASPGALALSRRVIALQGIAGQIKDQWRPFLEQQAAQTSETGSPQAAKSLLDAYKQGLTETIEADMDRQAHELASRENEADLKAAVVFLESSAGRALVAAERQATSEDPQLMSGRIAEAARAHYCPTHDCASVPSASAPR